MKKRGRVLFKSIYRWVGKPLYEKGILGKGIGWGWKVEEQRRE
jgi:hypothetical protein